MEKQVCLFLEGCGLINYIYRCVLTQVNPFDLLTFFSNRGSPFILNVIIQFFVLIAFACYQRTKNTLISCYLLQIGR
jgi:hypothetical protein